MLRLEPTSSTSSAPRRVYVGLTAAQQRRFTRNWIALMLMLSIGATLVPLVQWLSGFQRADLSIVVAISVPSLLILLIPLGRWLERRRVRNALARAGAICSGCGYSFQGLDERAPHCPECGHPRVDATGELHPQQPGESPMHQHRRAA